VRQAIRDKAYSAVLVHNHPCGEVKPSSDDVTLSRDLARAFDAVDIIFGDSVIVTENDFFSMREKGYLDNLNERYNSFDKK
jgi:DNA repair protein RadC